MNKIFSFFWKLTPSFFKEFIRYRIIDGWASETYSQEGEDMILRRIFANQTNGFFIDVGAHHPKRFSNTFYFYQKGWRGINIEPNPDMMKLFRKYRVRDINLNCGISTEKKLLEYFKFDEPALNTFDIDVLHSRIKTSSYKHINTINVNVTTLSDTLADYLPKNTTIDFMTIDVEGLDMEVLQSNDWSKYRPKWVLVEQLNLTSIENPNFEIHRYMKSLDYELFAKTFNTLFYKSR